LLMNRTLSSHSLSSQLSVCGCVCVCVIQLPMRHPHCSVFVCLYLWICVRNSGVRHLPAGRIAIDNDLTKLDETIHFVYDCLTSATATYRYFCLSFWKATNLFAKASLFVATATTCSSPHYAADCSSACLFYLSIRLCPLCFGCVRMSPCYEAAQITFS